MRTHHRHAQRRARAIVAGGHAVQRTAPLPERAWRYRGLVIGSRAKPSGQQSQPVGLTLLD